MVQVSPNTITGGDNGCGYSYEHTTIEGFAMTQMSGVGWYGDLGNFLTMPTTGELKVVAGKAEQPEDGYRSQYDKASETAKPGYYSVHLTDYDIRVETTAAPRAGMLRFTYPENKTSRIQIDLARRVAGASAWQTVRIVDDHTIAGRMECTPNEGGWGNGGGQALYTVYYYAQFSQPLKNTGVWSAYIPDGQARRLDGRQICRRRPESPRDRLVPQTEIFSGWDVFRSQMPLQTIISPDIVNDLINSLVTLAEESGKGYLERWEFLNAYSGCMLGNPAISVIADAYAKGIRGFDVELAWKYAVATTERFGNEAKGHSGSISSTLEHAYTEWCMAELARMLGKTSEQEKYLRLSQSYRNIWDRDEMRWFRPRQDNAGVQRDAVYPCAHCTFVPEPRPGLPQVANHFLIQIVQGIFHRNVKRANLIDNTFIRADCRHEFFRFLC